MVSVSTTLVLTIRVLLLTRTAIAKVTVYGDGGYDSCDEDDGGISNDDVGYDDIVMAAMRMAGMIMVMVMVVVMRSVVVMMMMVGMLLLAVASCHWSMDGPKPPQ